MSSRRARSASAAAVRKPAVVDDLPVSARVAWSYVAGVIAAVVTGLLVVILNTALVPSVCRAASGDAHATCEFAWLIWTTVVGFALCLLPAALALKLGPWLWAAAVAGLGLLLATGAIESWWWWLLAALIPAAAALLSANWERGAVLWRVQRVLIVVLDVVAAAALVWWYRQA